MLSYFPRVVANPRACDEYGNTFLHNLGGIKNLRYDKELLVSTLVERKSDVNAQNQFGATPLTMACFAKNIDVVRALIKAGADVNIGDTHGNSPLHMMTRSAKSLVSTAWVDILLVWADVNQQNRIGRTAIFATVFHNHVGAAKSLLKAKLDPNIRDANNNTVLREAVENQNVSLVKLLLEHNASL